MRLPIIKTSLVWNIYTCTYGYNQIFFGSSDREILPGKYCMLNPKLQHSPKRAQATLRGLSADIPTPAAPMDIIHQESWGKKNRKSIHVVLEHLPGAQELVGSDFLCQTLDFPREPSLHKFLSSFLNTLHFWPLQQHVPINSTFF